MLTVVIPVGPKPEHRQWLGECLESVRNQTYPADEIIMIDDGAGLPDMGPDVRIWATPWVAGITHAINFGVGLARNQFIITVGSDDIIRPWCIQDCLAAYSKHKDDLGYYWMDIEYSTGEIQKLASGSAMVTKALWRHTGGYPIEATVGAPDHIFVSAMLSCQGRAGRPYQVQSHAPPYWFRMREGQYQQTQNIRFGSVIGLVRDIIALEWMNREWPA